jgi:hypothetical protein
MLMRVLPVQTSTRDTPDVLFESTRAEALSKNPTLRPQEAFPVPRTFTSKPLSYPTPLASPLTYASPNLLSLRSFRPHYAHAPLDADSGSLPSGSRPGSSGLVRVMLSMGRHGDYGVEGMGPVEILLPQART